MGEWTEVTPDLMARVCDAAHESEYAADVGHVDGFCLACAEIRAAMGTVDLVRRADAAPDPEFAAAVESAGLLHAEYPDQMADASCSCEPEFMCGAHRLLKRYGEMYERLVKVQAERREAKAEVRRLRAAHQHKDPE